MSLLPTDMHKYHPGEAVPDEAVGFSLSKPTTGSVKYFTSPFWIRSRGPQTHQWHLTTRSTGTALFRGGPTPCLLWFGL